MKPIVFLGDPHLSDRQIQTRVDDSTETCLEKFNWVLRYANSLAADVLCTGDVFSHSLYSNRTRHGIKQMLRWFQSEGGAFYSCGGNHSGDVGGTDITTTVFRELGQFCYDGYIKYLGNYDGYFHNYVLPSGEVIAGYSAYSSGLESLPARDSVVGLVCHHWIMDAFGDTLVVYPDEMKKIFPRLKLIVAGHDHAFHEPYTSRDGVLVVRPGSMMRTDAGVSSKRIPEVAVWDPDADLWEYVEIACARPYEEVFYAERRQVEAESASAIDRFVQRMKQNVDVVLDVNSVVRSQFELVPVGDKPLIRDDLVSNGFVV
jgi:hypothetical protein